MDSEFVRILLIVVISYLLGSFPTAYLVGRLRNVNIFEVGSGNMGATNIVRVAGIGWGAVVWFFDSFKGIIAIVVATQILPESHAVATITAALSAIVGHNWSFFVTLLTGTLRGGKGAATAFGTLLMIVPLHIVAIVLAVCGLIIALTRYVSLGVLIMFSLAMGWILVLIAQNAMPWEYVFYSVAVLALLLVRFRENIQRLIAGTERRIGESASG
jgi:acyl phosphate:glycerol-3-phosphate acyltransferase